MDWDINGAVERKKIVWTAGFLLLLEGDLMRCDCLLLCVFCLSPLYDRDVCVCVCKGDYSLFSCNKCMRCVNV